MREYREIKEQVKSYYSSRAGLIALGEGIRQWQVYEQMEAAVKIKQKRVDYKPTEKVWCSFINILSGGSGTVEINQRVRPDRALQLAFGCQKGCAEQSVVQETLSACDESNVKQLEGVLTAVYRAQSRGYKHNYRQQWQILDVDLQGRGSGKKAEGSQKAYFSQKRYRRGRQVGRVVASRYEEIVCQRLYPGQTQLSQVLPELVQAAAEVLDLDEAKRARTLIRFDAGGGSAEAINALLRAGYAVHGKDYAGKRTKKLSRTIKVWFSDPTDPNRQFAWLPQETGLYHKPLYRLAIRTRHSQKRWRTGLLLSCLCPQTVLYLTLQPPTSDPQLLGLAYLALYDQRAGTIEISFKQDCQGLGVRRRNKKKFQGQQILLLLETLAHNTLLWLRHKLASAVPALAKLGLQRLVRDLVHIPGLLLFDDPPHLVQITLQIAHPLAPKLALAWPALPRSNISLILAQI
jgi:hypothetical protein